MAPLTESLFGRLDGGRRIAIIAVGVAVTAGVFGISKWATAPEYVPLLSDVAVESVGAIEDKLKEVSIPYKLERGGSLIKVPAANVAAARVALAREPLPGAGRPGLELFDKPTWGMTDFTQKVNFRRALEGELERSISTMRNVQRVKVHLALEEDKLFAADTRDSKASVTLAMRGGESPTQATVRGITSLVAGAVGGLDAEHVVVVDESGNALTTIDDASGIGLSSRQLTVQREMEEHLEKKAEEMLSRIVGAGNARVQVSAAINFDKIERTTQAVNPDQQAVSTEQKSEIIPAAGQVGAATSNSTTTFETTKSVESFTGAVGDVRKLTVAVLIADRVTFTPVAEGEPTPDPTITPRTAEELVRIESLVRNALGVDSVRGDALSIVSAPFDMPRAVAVEADSVPAPSMVTTALENPKPVVAIASLAVLLVLALVMVRALRAPKPTAATAALGAGAAAGTPGHMLQASYNPPAGALNSGQNNPMHMDRAREADRAAEERRQIVLPPETTSADREQAMATVEQRPDAALRVTRNWLRS